MFSYPVRSFRRPMISVCVIALGISLNASAKAPATPGDGSTVEQ